MLKIVFLKGQGITQVVAQAGYAVSVVDQNDKILKNAVDGIHASLKRVAKKAYEKDPKVYILVSSHSLMLLK